MNDIAKFLLEMVLDAEWSAGYQGYSSGCCPWCGGEQQQGGHTADCRFRAIMTRIELGGADVVDPALATMAAEMKEAGA